MILKEKSRKSTIAFIVIITALFISMSAIVISQGLDANVRGIAEIYQNGVAVTSVNIAESEGFRLTLEDGNGGFNTICVTGGKIGVEESNCPDKTCLNMGFISDGRFPIICLPHKVEIRFRENTSDFDGISY